MNPVQLWIIAGSVLCLLELIFPTAFVELMMGISAIMVAGIALVIPSPGIQVACWLAISTLLVVVSRRFLPQRPHRRPLQDAVEGETLTAILPGQAGRVLYEGNSWRAECQDPSLELAPQQKVYIIGRKGNTLMVYPVEDPNPQPLFPAE
jgi:membrane protein implicated in regulation of membrane protease activity